MAEIVDLRGRQLAPARPPVLADPSGRRARVLARTGRAIAIVFVLWLAGLALAGLGIIPASDVPLGRALAGPQAPPTLSRPPAPQPASVSDSIPALPPASSVTRGSSAAAGATATPRPRTALTRRACPPPACSLRPPRRAPAAASPH